MDSEGERHSSASSASDSDGYHSEVFGDEEVADQSLSEVLSSLITGPFLNGDSTTVTPVRPISHMHGSGGSILRELRKRSSPGPDPSPEIVKRARKQPPLPFCSNSQELPSTPKNTAFVRSQSVCIPPKESRSPNYFPSPGSENEERIGDHSKPYALPLVQGKRVDLKCISGATVRDLLKGKFDQVVSKYTLIDCRYPYEYEGGHIRGSKNIWQQEDLRKQLLSGPVKYPEEGKREIIIFHCEFSSKRGPDMCRYLRSQDRKIHGMDFPRLYYPELYLIEGGYKLFFEEHSDLCEPRKYVPMEDKEHSEELRKLKTDCPRKQRRPLAPRQNCCNRQTGHSRLKLNLN